jgi:diacylglycerol kinase family enzyme
MRATRTRVEGDALVQVDGELLGQLPMTFEIAPNSVEIITP